MILQGDCRDVLPTLAAASVQCCVTSPPYWGLRDYGVAGQLGLEPTPEEYVANMVAVFREVRRVLRPDGVLWLNLGDSYNTDAGGNWGHNHGKGRTYTADATKPYQGLKTGTLKPKDLCMIPARVALALQADGWWLRSDIIWAKPNPMPESVTDRPTKAHEYLFLLTRGERYYYDAGAIAEPAACGWNGSEFHTGKTGEHQLGRSQKVRPSARKGTFNGKTEAMADTGQNAFRAVTDTRNARSVWTIPTRPYSEAHFATFPQELARRCIVAGSRPGDTVLDPFNGAGTTGLVAQEHGREYIGIELNAEYISISERRLAQTTLGVA